MSTLAPIRDAIAARLASVPGIGRVHTYERYSQNEAKFKELFVVDQGDGTQQLRGWWLRRAKTEELSIALTRSVDVHTWLIRGYMALNDDNATELAFDALIEAFRDAVRADPTFGGICTCDAIGTEANPNPQLIEVADVGPVRFCGVLCHAAVLQLRTRSFL